MVAFLSSERRDLNIFAIETKDLKRVKALPGSGEDSEWIPGLLNDHAGLDEEEKIVLPKDDNDETNTGDFITTGTHTTNEEGDDSDTTDQGFDDVSPFIPAVWQW